MSLKVQQQEDGSYAVVDEAGNPEATGFDDVDEAEHYIEFGQHVDHSDQDDDVDEVLEDADEEDGYIAPNPDADDDADDGPPGVAGA